MIQRAAEIAAEAPWSQLADTLERLKAVRYTAEGETERHDAAAWC